MRGAPARCLVTAPPPARRPAVWDRPHEFEPERFPLDGPVPSEQNTDYRYIPFRCAPAWLVCGWGDGVLAGRGGEPATGCKCSASRPGARGERAAAVAGFAGAGRSPDRHALQGAAPSDRPDPTAAPARRATLPHALTPRPLLSRSGGPRKCVGDQFALMEAVTALAVLLKVRAGCWVGGW